MARNEHDKSELKIEEQPESPPFGIWLSLLAVGLVLAAIRPVSLVASWSFSTGAALQLFVSAWALVNLVLLFKRRRAFIASMIAYLVINAVLLLVLSLMAAGPPVAWPFVLVGTGVGVLWVVYLLQSRHVRQVCVR